MRKLTPVILFSVLAFSWTHTARANSASDLRREIREAVLNAFPEGRGLHDVSYSRTPTSMGKATIVRPKKVKTFARAYPLR